MSESIQIDWRQLHGEKFAGARALVTGGAGFIGSHLSEALVKLGCAVVVIDDLSGGARANLAGFGPVEFVEGSILDRDLLGRCMRGCRGERVRSDRKNRLFAAFLRSFPFSNFSSLPSIPTAVGIGAGAIRTRDLRFRKPPLYPTELRPRGLDYNRRRGEIRFNHGDAETRR